MRRYELEIQTRLAKDCQAIDYNVVAHYSPGACAGINCAPISIHMRAIGLGSSTYTLDCVIPNVQDPPICPGH